MNVRLEGGHGKGIVCVDVRGTLHTVRVRHSEFWARMYHHLGEGYARVWASDQVLRELNGRTVEEALDAGEPPKTVWRAVWSALELPASER